MRGRDGIDAPIRSAILVAREREESRILEESEEVWDEAAGDGRHSIVDFRRANDDDCLLPIPPRMQPRSPPSQRIAVVGIGALAGWPRRLVAPLLFAARSQ